jgi:hypothetical protein
MGHGAEYRAFRANIWATWGQGDGGPSRPAAAWPTRRRNCSKGARRPDRAPRRVGTIGPRSSRLNPSFNFNGNARPALEFYASVFGGNLSLNTFAQFGAADSPDAERIMHGMLETDAGYTIMGADKLSASA